MLAILALAVLAVMGSVDPPEQAPPAVIDQLPEGCPEDFPIRLSRTAMDFGRVDEGVMLQSELWFKNVSDNPVDVSYSPRQGYGAAGLGWTLALGPGEARRIEYALDTRHRRGEVLKKVLVHVGDLRSDDGRAIGMDITATVLPAVFFEPVKVYLMEVPSATGKTQTIYAYGRGIDFDIADIKVEGVDGATPPALKITREPSVAVCLWDETYIKIPITLEVPPGTPVGEHWWNIRFTPNREP